ncbi:MAG TPA: MMPL family transporter [Desulfuromonadaceae bacterium]|jgi:hypothetical protein
MVKALPAKLSAAVQSAVTAHLEWVFRLSSAKPGQVIAAALVFLALALTSLLNTRFEADIFKLFPSKQGALKLFLQTLQWSGSAQEAYFLLEGDRQALLAEVEPFVLRLKSLKVDGQSAFSKVIYRTYDPGEAKAFADFIGYAVARPQLFLKVEQVDNFAGRLLPANMDRSLKRAQAELASQAGMAMRDIIAVDPLYLRDLILPRLNKATQALDLDTSSPYLLSRDGRVLIVIAETARPVQDMQFARKLVTGINKARQGFSVHISCAGAHLSAVIDEATMKRNILACIISSLFVVLGLFYLTYRRVLPTLLIPLILLVGVALSLGTAGFFLSSIHIISFAFMALIIGLGTDYSIHIYDRFYSERSAGKSTDEALRLSMIDSGRGVFTAATTTAFPFLALMVTEVRALSELGLLVGLGVIFSMYATFFFLPPLLIFSEQRFPNSVYKPLPNFGLGRVWNISRKNRFATIAVSTVLIAILLIAALFISFEGELRNLQPKQSEAFLTQQKIEKHLSLASRQMLVAVEGIDLDDVLARGRKVGALVENYRLKKQLAAYSSLGQVLNDQPSQNEVLEKLQAQTGLRRPGTELAQALVRHGFEQGPFQPAINNLEQLKYARPVAMVEAIQRLAASPLRGLAERHLIRAENSYHLLFYLYYQGEEFNQPQFLKELAGLDPSARATGEELVSRQLAGSVKRSFLWGFILGGVMVLLLLITHFESLEGVFYSLYPVMAGVIAMLGLMVLAGMKLNFMNAMVLVTILGMGSDYGLHLAHRTSTLEEGQQASYTQAGRAVLLSALTTIAGFGSLALSDYGALASIGWATNFGVAATALVALFSLPAFIGLIVKK